MRNLYQRVRSGPHSVHDARQYAWALLIFGPGAPAPRQRSHPDLPPEVPDAERPARRPSLLARLTAWFRRSSAGRPADGADPPGKEGRLPTGRNTNDEGRLAA